MKDPFGIENISGLKSKERVVIGTYIPRHLAEKLALLSVAKGRARSHMILTAIERLIQQENISENEAIQKLADQVRSKWQFYAISYGDSKENQENYVRMIRKVLAYRGVSRTTINQILEKAGLT